MQTKTMRTGSDMYITITSKNDKNTMVLADTDAFFRVYLNYAQTKMLLETLANMLQEELLA